MQQLPQAIVRYLEELELTLKQRIGVVPENALADAREFLLRDHSALQASEPGMASEQVFQHFCEVYGQPAAVADAYEDSTTPSHKFPGYAPGWRICCTKCGRSAPAAKVGVTRVAAVSRHKYVLGWCHDCRWLRPMRLSKDLDATNLTASLGIFTTPEQLRRSSHKPWLVNAIWAALLVVPLVLISSVAIKAVAARQAVTEADVGTFKKMPPGWKVVRQIEIGPQQLQAFSNKLGGKLTYANNTFITDEENTSLQINELLCESLEDSSQVYKSLLKLKSDSRSLIRNANTVYEFVYRDVAQARLATKARYQLSLQPELVRYRVRLSVAPVAKGDAMNWNPLFNACLASKAKPSSESAAKRLQDLAEQFDWGESLSVRAYGLGAATSVWKVKGAASAPANSGDIHQSVAVASSAAARTFPELDLVGTIECSNTAVTPLLPTEDRKEYLRPTSAWPAESKQILALSRKIVGKAKDDEQKLLQILNWFTKDGNIRTGGQTGSRYGTLKVLQQKFGNCWDYSDVLITLCRASELPSRQVFGWLVGSEGHVWCEVLLDDGWHHVDPMTGYECGSDYVPFFTSKHGELPPVYTSMPAIEVLP